MKYKWCVSEGYILFLFLKYSNGFFSLELLFFMDYFFCQIEKLKLENIGNSYNVLNREIEIKSYI